MLWPSYERNAVVELTCVIVPGRNGGSMRFIETRHDLETRHDTKRVRGRVVDIVIQHADGSIEQVERLPSGAALRGFDERDDGHLERVWTGEPVVADSNRYLLTIAS